MLSVCIPRPIANDYRFYRRLLFHLIGDLRLACDVAKHRKRAGNGLSASLSAFIACREDTARVTSRNRRKAGAGIARLETAEHRP